MLSKDNKGFALFSMVIFLAVLFSYQLPHHTCTISEFLIRPIQVGGGYLYLSGLLPLILFIIGFYGMIHLERFAKWNKILVFLLLVTLFIPFLKWAVDVGRSSYHRIVNDNMSAVDIDDAEISINTRDDLVTVTFQYTIVDYSKRGNTFKCRIHLPKSLGDALNMVVYEPDTLYSTKGNRMKQTFMETFEIESKDNSSVMNLVNSNWYREDTTYELYNDKDSIKIIDYGFDYSN